MKLTKEQIKEVFKRTHFGTGLFLKVKLKE